MNKRKRGGALPSTLIVILLLTVFGLTLVNLAALDLHASTRANQREMAFNAAETGLENVIAELSLDPTVGKANQVFQETLADGSSYRVSFDDSVSYPFSVNNLDGLSGAPGFAGRTVPPLYASLFAQGFSPNGEESVVECLIRLEGLPYAVAGTAKVKLSSTTVLGAQRLSEAGAPGLTGNVYSGATGSGSTTLSGLTNVSGDARSAGGITVNLPATVVGEKEPNHDPENLPDLVVKDFRNDTTPGVSLRVGGTIPGVAILSGNVYFDGTTTLASATLVDATVYVNGDLNVGAITGSGTIFVDGKTNFLAAVNLTGTNRVTIFSQDDINLGIASVFQGVLYTHGNVNTPPLAATIVLGAVYAVNYLDPGKGNVTMGLGSVVVHVSELTAFASSYLARSGEANAVRTYWCRIK